MDNLYYIAVHFEDKRSVGNIPDIGQWENYYVYELDADTISRLDFTNALTARFPSKDVAYAWKFAGDIRDFIRVGEYGITSEQVGKHNLHFHKPGKFTYYITDEDRQNGIEFAKIVLKAKINRDFANIAKYTQEHDSQVSNAYVTMVYAMKDAELVADLENRMPTLVKNYRRHVAYMQKIATELHNLECMVDSIKTPLDVRGVQDHLRVTLIELPKTIVKDRKISNV